MKNEITHGLPEFSSFLWLGFRSLFVLKRSIPLVLTFALSIFRLTGSALESRHPKKCKKRINHFE